MDPERTKEAVLAVLAKAVDARTLAEAIGSSATEATVRGGPTPTAARLLERVVLGDILDEGILEAGPRDRSFPLRLFFSELGRLVAADGPETQLAEHAFTVASGLNFYFRAPIADEESRVRIGIEVSRSVYALAHEAKLDAELLPKAATLLAALMSSELERARFESVDHAKVFDSQIHERADGSDPTGSRIVRPASFACRVVSNSAVKAKAQVVT